jgi:Zn-dependent protease
MRLSWKIGRIAGIDVFIHATFLLVYFLVRDKLAEGGEVAVGALVLLLSAFGCVVLHELGHALMARRFGIVTEDITLYPIGGVARLRRMPRAPGAELLIALAGPAVNFAIVAGLICMDWLGLITLIFAPEPANLATNLLLINVVLGTFNLIPAFPMDGGRVLRAVLSGFVGRARATTYAATVGRVLAVLFAIAVLRWTHEPLQLALAAFVYFGGRMEEAQVLAEERRRAVASEGSGIAVAPPGYHWVNRGGGVWQLAPIGARIVDPEPSSAPWA